MGSKHAKLLYHHGHIRDSVAGFSLVELMVALAIAAFLGIGLWGLMTSQNKTYAAQDNTSQMQQNLRAAVDQMSRDLLAAGQEPPWQMTINGQSTAAWYVYPKPYGILVANRLDMIGCPGGMGVQGTLNAAVASGANQIVLAPGHASFTVNSYINIGDARFFESAQVTGVTGDTLTIDTNPGGTTHTLVNNYSQGTSVCPIQWITYLVTGGNLTRDQHDGTAPAPVVASNITGLSVVAQGTSSLQITLTGSAGVNGIQSTAVNTIHLRNQ